MPEWREMGVPLLEHPCQLPEVGFAWGQAPWDLRGDRPHGQVFTDLRGDRPHGQAFTREAREAAYRFGICVDLRGDRPHWWSQLTLSLDK